MSTPRHYCNVTFVPEGSLREDGQPIKLKRCTRCESTFYLSREAQSKHWSLHKKLCRPAEEFAAMKRQIFSSGVVDALNILANALLLAQGSLGLEVPGSPRAGYAYLWVLQRLEQLAREGDNSRYHVIHPFTSSFHLFPDKWIETFWAIPGMATYLLNLDIASEPIKALLLENPHDDDMVPNFEMLSANGFQPHYQLNNDFCDLITSLLVGSAFIDRIQGHPLPAYRQSRVAAAASLKIMEWSKDPFRLVSIPKHCNYGKFTAREGMFMILLPVLLKELPTDPLNPEALAPGLTAEAAARVILNFIAADYLTLRPVVVQSWVDDLSNSIVARPAAWEAFSITRRAKLAELIAIWVILRNEFKGMKQALKYSCHNVTWIVMGWRHDYSMWIKVIKECRLPFFSDWFKNVLESIRPSLKEFLGASKVYLPIEIEDLICVYALGPGAVAVGMPDSQHTHD